MTLAQSEKFHNRFFKVCPGIKAWMPASAFIVSNIHDEIIVECDEADSASVRGILEDVMAHAMKEIYPEVACEVEAKIGSTWDEAK